MRVWLVELSADAVPAGDAWLGAEERAKLAGLAFEPRRASYRLGRYAIKRAARALLPDVEAARVDTVARADGSPSLLVDGVPWAGQLSLSHTDGLALVAISSDVRRLGCDVERVVPARAELDPSFFTAAEQRALDASEDRATLATYFFSAKEAAMKLGRTGARRPFADFEVQSRPEIDHYRPLWLLDRVTGETLRGGAAAGAGVVVTYLSEPGCFPPVSSREGLPGKAPLFR